MLKSEVLHSRKRTQFPSFHKYNMHVIFESVSHFTVSFLYGCVRKFIFYRCGFSAPKKIFSSSIHVMIYGGGAMYNNAIIKYYMHEFMWTSWQCEFWVSLWFSTVYIKINKGILRFLRQYMIGWIWIRAAISHRIQSCTKYCFCAIFAIIKHFYLLILEKLLTYFILNLLLINIMNNI